MSATYYSNIMDVRSRIDNVESFYSLTQSSILNSLTRDWSRYGWDEIEIEEKINKLKQVWNNQLMKLGLDLEAPRLNWRAAINAEKKKDLAKLHQQNNNYLQNNIENIDETNQNPKKKPRNTKRNNQSSGVGPRISAPLSYIQPSYNTTLAASIVSEGKQQELTSAIPAQNIKTFNNIALDSIQNPFEQPRLLNLNNHNTNNNNNNNSNQVLPVLPARIPQSDGAGDEAEDDNNNGNNSNNNNNQNNNNNNDNSNSTSSSKTNKRKHAETPNETSNNSNNNDNNPDELTQLPPELESLAPSIDPTKLNANQLAQLTDTNIDTTSSAIDPHTVKISQEEWNRLNGEELSALDNDPDLDDSAIALQQTENIILCQYERVTHTKGNWRVILKDGIAHIDGKEYIFAVARGDLTW